MAWILSGRRRASHLRCHRFVQRTPPVAGACAYYTRQMFACAAVVGGLWGVANYRVTTKKRSRAGYRDAFLEGAWYGGVTATFGRWGKAGIARVSRTSAILDTRGSTHIGDGHEDDANG